VKVLKLSAQGLPQSWISLEQAVIHYAAGEVRWESGGEVAIFRGGHNAVTGQQSIIRVNSIIGTRGVPNINPFNLRPGLTNAKLFIRDRNVCAYCGGHFHETDLTREHIIPFAQNGIDTWMNVVTACKLSPLFLLLHRRVIDNSRLRYRNGCQVATRKYCRFGLRVHPKSSSVTPTERTES